MSLCQCRVFRIDPGANGEKKIVFEKKKELCVRGKEGEREG